MNWKTMGENDTFSFSNNVSCPVYDNSSSFPDIAHFILDLNQTSEKRLGKNIKNLSKSIKFNDKFLLFLQYFIKLSATEVSKDICKREKD